MINHSMCFRKTIPLIPPSIKDQDDARKWIAMFPHLKETMDLYFSKKSKLEREFQQVVAHENNNSNISNETEYFISDIEIADSGLGARFDMTAIRWLASQRKNGSTCRAALIEMKYGDGALSNSSGLLDHLKDIGALFANKEKYKSLIETMELQFNQLNELGLLNFKQCSNGTKVKLDTSEKPEVIFILANHNPRSTKLSSIVNKSEVDEYIKEQSFDLKFFVAHFAGYGLHSKCMLELEQFRKLLKEIG